MSLVLWRAILWPFAGLGAMALGAALIAAPMRTGASPGPSAVSETARSVVPRANLDSVSRVVGARDLFRRSRLPGPKSVPINGAGAPAVAQRPDWTLVGVVFGPEPTAILEGLPGAQGPRVVRPGDVIGEFTVRRITRGTVEVSGMDTVWVLTVREPWRKD